MDRLQFVVPVRIQTDPGRPIEEIYGVKEALTFLQNWPVGRQGPVFQTAFNSCFGVMNNQISTDDARKSFNSFARITGILVKDIHHAASPGYPEHEKPLTK